MASVGGKAWMGGVLLLALTLASACARPSGRSPGGSDAEIRRGESLYRQYCIGCHGGPTGGSMMDYPPRHNANGHTWHHPDCQLKGIIQNGGDAMTAMMRRMMAPPSTPAMPAFRGVLTDEEIEAILAFIKTWWTEEQRRYQAQITRVRCP